MSILRGAIAPRTASPYRRVRSGARPARLRIAGVSRTWTALLRPSTTIGRPRYRSASTVAGITQVEPIRPGDGWRCMTKRDPSVHAHRLELLAPGIGDRRLAAVSQEDRRAVGRVQGIEQCPRCQLRRLRELLLHVLGADHLHISDLAAAE